MPAPRPFLVLWLAVLLGCPPSDDDTGDDTADDTADSDSAQPTAVVSVSATVAFLLVGETTTLTATTANATDAGYTWASSDDLVATVDTAGLVTAHGHGEVTVTATGTTTQVSDDVTLTVSQAVPYQDDWAGSAHAAYDDEPFTHWDEDGEVSSSCSKCHTTTGFRDWIGDDGTAADDMEGPHPIGQVIECVACHNDGANALSHVVFPSGVVVEGLGPEAICMTCHQGRSSKDSVDDEIASAQATGTEPPGEDNVDPDLGFVNIHYYAAAATLFGGVARGGYEYDDLLYDHRFRHHSSKDVCIECHDQHTLQLRLTECAGCHPNVVDADDTHDIRMIASASRDYDGDGNLTEGLYHEVAGLREKLLGAIQTAAREHSVAVDICYDVTRNPFWFVDANGNGTCDSTETTSYDTWTPRLTKAAYDYQVATKDPGSFAHNGKYIIELLYDAITDLNEATTADADLSAASRTDPGHFDATGEPFRHWDEDEEVSASCSRCHGGAQGFHFYVQYGVTIDVLGYPNGLECETCHTKEWNYQGAPQFLPVGSVTYPGGTVLDDSTYANPQKDTICATCHQGREGKKTIDDYLAINDGSTGSNYPTFRNVHYLPASAMLQGSTAHVGYEYDGNTYTGKWDHLGGTSCSTCHDGSLTKHTFDVRDTFELGTGCGCHGGNFPDADFEAKNYDGNASTTTLKADLTSYQDALLAAMNAYVIALEPDHQPICWKNNKWYVDATPFGGRCGPEDTASYPKGTNGWDDEMIKAAHNFQFSSTDPGAWAHNMDYITELLYDSIEQLDPTQLGTLSRGEP